MTVTKTFEGTTLTVAIEGKIDVVTSPMLEEELGKLEGVEDSISSKLKKVSFLAFKSYSILV